MAENGEIRVKTPIDAISDRLAQLTRWLEDLNKMANIGSGTYTINPTSGWWTDEEEGRFDPENVDWEQLIELYRDDPALTFIFGQLEEYFSRQVPGFRSSDKTIRWDDGSGATSLPQNAVGSGTSTPGLYLYSDTTSTKVSDPVTVRYDANGTMTVTYDEE